MLRLFCQSKVSFSETRSLSPLKDSLLSCDKELCLYVDSKDSISDESVTKLKWLMAGLCDQEMDYGDIRESSHFSSKSLDDCQFIIEVGPRLGVCTPFCTNAMSICASSGLLSIGRIEVSRRYRLGFKTAPLPNTISELVESLFDRMTECVYQSPLEHFSESTVPEPWGHVDVMTHGVSALHQANQSLGLAFDERDIDMYFELFHNKLGRNPSTVECFDLAQSNSEHSRHWFFKGNLVIDGVKLDKSLLKMVMETQQHSSNNSVIMFSDNSSVIEGGVANSLVASTCVGPSQITVVPVERHLLLTAETHNFPTGIEPFSGAATGVGGRIRDVQAVARGGHVIAGTAGYCVGNLHIPGHLRDFESGSAVYPSTMASALHVLLGASDGASDYGNKFGEPLVLGFCRTFGQQLAGGGGERREWIKPIMFSGGLGSVDALVVEKKLPRPGMQVVKLGGPAYRIGIGGGAASSVQVQGDNKGDRDYSAVQRGDAEMEQKLNRVIRACVERGSANPILSIHDQGAGGNGNVLKELVDPEGAVIFTEEFDKGDPSLSVLELWGAEYQESNAILCGREDTELLRVIGARENCPISFVGEVTGDGKIVLREGSKGSAPKSQDPVSMCLKDILGEMPAKVFEDKTVKPILTPLQLPKLSFVEGQRDETCSVFLETLGKVLSLPSVASKRYLTNKVDRSVGGLVAQQQCLGPLHTPIADAAVLAVSHYDTWGVASAIGEQPIKCMISAEAGARLSLAEAITNLVFVPITCLQDVKCSVNWMWPAKLAGETCSIVAACSALCRLMVQLGVAADGGKDSLSMAARLDSGEVVKSPGSVVVSAYVKCPDITGCVTPDIKSHNSRGRLLLVNLNRGGQCRLGGTALAQSLGQLGDQCPDLDSAQTLKTAFQVTQRLITEGRGTLLSGHDVSDGGVLVCVLEMAIAGSCGISLHWETVDSDSLWAELMGEEPGWVVEVDESNTKYVTEVYEQAGAFCVEIGHVTSDRRVCIRVGSFELLYVPLEDVARMWESTSYYLEKQQVEPSCAEKEWTSVGRRTGPLYQLPANYAVPRTNAIITAKNPLVAVIREEGSNGDREMAHAFNIAGFQVWDVTMSDLKDGKITLHRFRGVAFPGGFSYADVFGSGVGWAAGVRFNTALTAQFEHFRRRADVFSLGVCNGCQLMALLGWVPGSTEDHQTGHQSLRLVRNKSGRFESRFSSVRVQQCSSPLLRGLSGSVLGVWVAHAEGRFQFNCPHLLSQLKEKGQVALCYTDDAGQATEEYPHNPNGSEEGLAAVCSEDGRHLAMMPHPERCIISWQWPHMPPSLADRLSTPGSSQSCFYSPWISLFCNAFDWCSKN